MQRTSQAKRMKEQMKLLPMQQAGPYEKGSSTITGKEQEISKEEESPICWMK